MKLIALVVASLGFAAWSSTASPQASPSSTEQADVTCRAPQHACPRCDGTGTYCATHCYECPAP